MKRWEVIDFVVGTSGALTTTFLTSAAIRLIGGPPIEISCVIELARFAWGAGNLYLAATEQCMLTLSTFLFGFFLIAYLYRKTSVDRMEYLDNEIRESLSTYLKQKLSKRSEYENLPLELERAFVRALKLELYYENLIWRAGEIFIPTSLGLGGYVLSQAKSPVQGFTGMIFGVSLYIIYIMLFSRFAYNVRSFRAVAKFAEETLNNLEVSKGKLSIPVLTAVYDNARFQRYKIYRVRRVILAGFYLYIALTAYYLDQIVKMYN